MSASSVTSRRKLSLALQTDRYGWGREGGRVAAPGQGEPRWGKVPPMHSQARRAALLTWSAWRCLQVQVSSSPVYNTGRRLGKGGFGQVFLGTRSQKSRSAKDNKPVEVNRAFLLGGCLPAVCGHARRTAPGRSTCIRSVRASLDCHRVWPPPLSLPAGGPQV